MNYNENQLKAVSDKYGSLNKYNVKEYNDLANLGTEFLYDTNANMIADYDREIVSIRYNLLNLQDTIQFKNGNQIIFNQTVKSGRGSNNISDPAPTPIKPPKAKRC